MDSLSPPVHDSFSQKDKDVVSSSPSVDPFLKEALQNPRHRLTILRMELDIQRFMQNPDQQQFEFQHFPTSYLRLAAHRVAQHYGLQSMVLDTSVDGLGTKIVVRKTAESRYPAVCLSEVPAEQAENDKPEQVKLAIRPRPHRSSSNDMNELGTKRSPVRTVEERKEEYDRARARIFSSSSSPDLEGASFQATVDGRSLSSGSNDSEGCRNVINELEKTPMTRDASNSSRIAIFRDREKDRSDPDYDRSYERYIRSLPPNQNFSLGPFNMQNFHPSFAQYETGFPQLNRLPRSQTSLSYRPTSSPIMSPFCAVGLNQTSGDAVYMQWPSPTMMYAQSYEPLRHSMFQAPFYHQPLSFDYSQNH
ncbi:Single-stranded nucleic acid binding R3H [Macleaya cordata]|uniref:Single-stranded nucleic acid binding R3H n=1 Tax=Macleaya cordata TaxID=56857 RepID=A0A200RD85_MACCD|nr:Single-stranded nucleic acid binding R3H [Macleaya cordata]